MEFWKEIQRQNKDPDEREEFLRQYLQDNHSDLKTGELTIKPADVIPLFTEEYDPAAKPVIPRLRRTFFNVGWCWNKSCLKHKYNRR